MDHDAVAALHHPKRDTRNDLRKRTTLAPGLQGRLDGPRARGGAPAGLEAEHRLGVAAPLLRERRVDVGRGRRARRPALVEPSRAPRRTRSGRLPLQ